MSSATVAAPRGFTMPQFPLWFVGVALMLAVVVGVAAGSAIARSAAPNVANTSAPVRHHNVFPASKAPTISDYRTLVANLAAAEDRHDFQAQYRFGSQLDRILTPGMIGYVYQEHARLVAALGSSDRDSHAALVTREIAKLCGPAAVKAQLDFCN